MLSPEQLEKFNNDGYLVLENFLTVEKCEQLKNEMNTIIESNHFVEQCRSLPKFSEQDRDQYFLNSVDKLCAFLESNADEVLQSENADHSKVFNKVGHALHVLNPLFKEVTFSEAMKNAFRSIGYVKPIVCQSMYIFKQPRIGDKVIPHQDGSYLYTEPLRVVGVWIALEDCTVKNGCLQFIPGSHKWELGTRFIRNPNKEEFENGKCLIYTKEAPKYNDADFVPAEIKAGSAIMIDGLVVHKSESNKSDKSRHIYTFHVYDGEGTVFTEENWMIPSPISFVPLYEYA